jgi:hypothetical protein
MYGVSEADVDLYADTCRRHRRGHRHTHALVELVLADACSLHGGGIERHAIRLDGHGDDLAEDPDQPTELGGALAEQVEVACCAVWHLGPGREQHGPLEQEQARVRRRGQSVQQTLEHELRHQQLHVVATLLCQVAQPRLHGSAEILGRLGHTMASR